MTTVGKLESGQATAQLDGTEAARQSNTGLALENRAGTTFTGDTGLRIKTQLSSCGGLQAALHVFRSSKGQAVVVATGHAGGG